MKLRKTLMAAALAAPLMLAGAANAAILVDDWMIDTTVVGPEALAGGRVITGIDVLGFNDAPIKVTLGAGGLAVGSGFDVTGKLAISQILNDVTGAIAPPEMNQVINIGGFDGFELTATFSVSGVIVGAAPPNFTYDHFAGGLLTVFLDNLTNGGKATPGTGAGYADGTPIATFTVLAAPNDGGTLNTTTLDGADDIFFLLTGNPFGALKDSGGNPLVPGQIIAFTDSNFDLDADNDGIPDEQRGGLGCPAVGSFGPGGTFCAVEDGTVRLQVPEPGVLTLLGIGLLGLVGALRFRRG